MSTSEVPVSGGSTALKEKVRSLQLSERDLKSGRGSGAFPWILSVLLGTLACLFALGFFGLGLGWFDPAWFGLSGPAREPVAENQPSQAETHPTHSPAATKTSPAEAGEVVLESKGYIIPAHQILVSPKVNGMVLKLRVEEGLRVKRGEILAELESIDYQSDVDRLRAALGISQARLKELENGNRKEEIDQVKAELEEALVQRDQLKTAYDRSIMLLKSKTISENDFEVAESNYKAILRRIEKLENAYQLMVKGARMERLDLARSEVRQAEAELAKAEWRLSNCTIRAPISGTILKKNAEEGNIVNPVAFNGSFSLCDMADLSDLEVDLSIQERDVSRVFKGQKCTVRAEAFPDRKYEGYVSRLMPIADRAKGAVPVRVKLFVPAEEEGVYLKPEMGAVVSFRNEKLTSIPKSAPLNLLPSAEEEPK